jgi:DNA-directed RNA polymerase subunit RPC12/RpoP
MSPLHLFNCHVCGHEWSESANSSRTDDCPNCGEAGLIPSLEEWLPNGESGAMALDDDLGEDGEVNDFSEDG